MKSRNHNISLKRDLPSLGKVDEAMPISCCFPLIPSRSKYKRTAIGLCFALASFGAHCDEATRALTVDDVLGALSSIPERRDCFVESKYTALLTEPLKSAGTLTFRSPSYIEKRTLTPEPEYFAAENEQLTVQDARNPKPRTLKLASYPPLQGLVTAFRGSLAGDATALGKFFESSIQGTAAAWTLALRPKNELKKMLTRIEVAGSGATVRRFTVYENGGDYSVTEIVPCADKRSGHPQ